MTDTPHPWDRRAAYIEWTVRECQDAIKAGLAQLRKRFIDVANTLLDDGGLPSIRAASQIVRDHFPPAERVADVSDAERFEDLSDIPDEDLDRMRAIRDEARRKNKLKETDE